MQIIFPPRPKGKIAPGELKSYQTSGNWLAQRKFRGSRAVIHISADRQITLGNRHGASFSRFDLDQSYKQEFLTGLNLKPNTEYWLDGELMNKDKNSTFEVILFDVLHIGKYLFRNPTQVERLNLLQEICNFPKNLCSSGIALEVTKRIWMAQSFFSDFVSLFNEALPIPQLEGLVLRKKNAGLDNTGFSYYETTNLIRCRKPFGCDTPKEGRSGGYQF